MDAMEIKHEVDRLLAEWANLLGILRRYGDESETGAWATRAIEDRINRYLNREQDVETTAHYVVVARTDYERGKRVVSLQPFGPELTSEELDAISDKDYEALMDEWENYAFTIRPNDRNSDVSRYPSDSGVVQVETDQDWTPGTVLRLTVAPIGSREQVEALIRPVVEA